MEILTMNQTFNILFYVFIIAYSLLTIVAALQDIRLQGFQYWHSFYFIGSIILLISLLPTMPQWVLPLSLVLLVIIAAGNGILTNTFQWNHIIVRTLISFVLSFVWYKYFK